MTATLLDLAERRARGDAAVARVAAEPVRHVPWAFLAALECAPVAPAALPRPRVLQLAR